MMISEIPRLRVLVASLAPELHSQYRSLLAMGALTLLQLTVVGSLLDEVEDLLSESRIGDGPGSGAVLFFRHIGWV